jgi:hypothetical protein
VHIGLEQFVIGFQALLIVFLVVLVLLDQMRRPSAPREPQPRTDDSPEIKNRTADPEKEGTNASRGFEF